MANNWEYHQDGRDRAYGCAALMFLGTLVLAALAMAVIVALILLQIWQP